ncbi:MAG: hypothetical protein V4622_10290 [Bacteroidota bacterium]
MKKILFLLLVSKVSFFFGQFDIKWSEMLPAKGRVLNVLPVSYSDFYTTRYMGPRMFQSLYISKHSNFAVTSKGKVTSKLEKGVGIVEGLSIINDVPVVFISDKKDGENTIYYQKYSNLCEPFGTPKEIISYKMPKGWKRKGEFYIYTSENKDFFCIDYEIPGSKEEKDKFGYKVLTSDFEVVSEGEYELPYESNMVSISNNYLSNTGDYFLAAKVYKNDGSKKMFKSRTNLDKVVLMHVTPSGLEEFDLEFKNGKTISDLTFSSDNNKIMSFTGLYGDDNSSGIKGVFFFQLNYAKKQITNEGWNEFGKDFITEGWSDRSKEKAEKRTAKGKGEPELFEYDLRDIHTLADGSMIGMLEQYFVRVSTYTDPKTGTTTTTYTYYYNDLIVYKINKDGSFDWMKKIKKSQVSSNDGGYFSSVASFVSGNKLNILFNDNLKNYDEGGNFVDDNNRFYSTSYRKKTNTVSLVELDLEEGGFTRKTFFDRKDTKAYAVPKKFSVDYNKKEMLMLLVYGKKEKYGVLSFE